MENEPIGVLGIGTSSSMSSNSGLERSTSGLGLSSRRRSRSDSSVPDAALEMLGEIIAREARFSAAA